MKKYFNFSDLFLAPNLRFLMEELSKHNDKNKSPNQHDLWFPPFALAGHLFQTKGQMTRPVPGLDYKSLILNRSNAPGMSAETSSTLNTTVKDKTKKDSEAKRNATKQYNLDDKGTFFRWWYNNRTPQITQNISSVLRIDKEKARQKTEQFLNGIDKTLSSFTEMTPYPYSPVSVVQTGPSQRLFDYMGAVYNNLTGDDKVVDANNFLNVATFMKNNGVRGVTNDKMKNTLYLNPETPRYPQTVVHERTHELTNFDDIGQTFIEATKNSGLKLKNGVSSEKYIDDPKEVYSRLMEFRYKNRLDPKKKYNKKDIEKFRRDDSLKDVQLDDYDDNTLLILLNDVAQNNMIYSENTNII